MPTIQRDSVCIFYETFGDKNADEIVVMLSGAGTDHGIWRYQCESLKENAYILAINHRGSGKSDRPDGAYSVDMLVADVLGVLEAEQITQITLVGFSLGGLIAMGFVNRYPSKVKRMALFNCSLGAGNPDTVLPSADVINMFIYSSALTPEDVCRNAADYHFGEGYETADPKAYRVFFDYVMGNQPGIEHYIPILVSNQPFITDFGRVSMPVLVVLSTDDPVTPKENGSAFQKYLPHARIEYLDGHHASMLIHPRKVTALLTELLSSY